MASTDAAKSPLEHVWRQFIPQGHDQPLKNAFYNVAAVVFVGGAAAAAWSVYLILQPFVQALMWAVLCGSVLHPLKYKIGNSARKWLQDVHETKSLLSLSVALLPVTFLDNLSEFIGWYVMSHVKGVIAVTVVLPLVYIVIHHTPSALSQLAYKLISCVYYTIKFFLDIVGYLNYFVILVVLLYFGLAFFSMNSDNQHIFRRLSLPIWILAFASASCWWSSFSVPLFIIFCLLLFGGLWTEVVDMTQSQDSNVVDSLMAICMGQDESAKKCEPEKKDKEVSEDEKLVENLGEHSEIEDQDGLDKEPPQLPLNISRPSTLPSSQSHETTPIKGEAKVETPTDSNSEKGQSNIYLKTVLVACVLVELWRHSYLLSLLPLAFVYYIVKKTTSYHIFGDGILKGKVMVVLEKGHTNLHSWYETRRKVLLTPPLVGVFKLLKSVDRRIVGVLGVSVDAVVTIFIMVSCIVFLLIASIFLAVQIQGEGMQLIAMGSQLINATIVNNPQLHELLPDGLNNVVGSALDNGYLYGREWIGNMVRNMLGEKDNEKAAMLEKQVIELWDNVYQAWVVAHPQPPYEGPVVTSAAVAITFDSLIDGLMKTPGLDPGMGRNYAGLISLTTISDVIRDNLGTVMNVVEGVWTILLSNLSLALSTLTTAFSLLLGGSLSILNALLNLVVFMSSLFYILSTSDEVYKPVAILSGFAPGQMNSLGAAVEESVNGVFKASFKMGAFYGMWTWLLHSIFDTNIVYIPSVLGALFGAVPLVGTYWAAVPGALELVWGHGSPFMGLLLIVAQLLPLSCVDTAIYAEIKGGGHPYLTGLAVAGGIFCWGVEGAILGPLLLCILLVVTKMYTSLIQSPSEFNPRFKKFRR